MHVQILKIRRTGRNLWLMDVFLDGMIVLCDVRVTIDEEGKRRFDAPMLGSFANDTTHSFYWAAGGKKEIFSGKLEMALEGWGKLP